MEFARPLIRATLLRRYKRFLADARLEDGREVTAHCANPGAMTGLAEPGAAIWLEPNDDPARKLRYSWKLVGAGAGLVCIDTAAPNRIVAEALRARAIPALAMYCGVRAEAKFGARARFDFLLTEPGLPDLWVEVKAVTLRRGAGPAEFPDCPTARGAKHLEELSAAAATGARAAMLYLLMREDADAVALAADIDPGYAAAYAAARAAGVEAIAHRCHICPQGLRLGAAIPAPDPAGGAEAAPRLPFAK